MSSKIDLRELKQKKAGRLKYLNPAQVEMIDEALSALGDYGEIRLVVEKGRLRFIVTQTSIDALKWRPGSINNGSR